MNVRGIYCITTFLMSAKVLWELKKFVKNPESKSWLHFFLWVNFSLIVYIAAAAVDLWSVYSFVTSRSRTKNQFGSTVSFDIG